MNKKFCPQDFRIEKNKTNNIYHALDYLTESDNFVIYLDVDDFIKKDKDFKFVKNDDLPSKYFSEMNLKDGDSVLFALKRDKYLCIVSDEGEVAKLYYREGKNTIFIQEKDQEQATSFLIRVIQKEIASMLEEDPDHVVEQDYRRRKRTQDRAIENKREELRNNGDDFPEDFWEGVQHIYEHCDNYIQFRELLEIGDARASDCRPLQRIQRATSALIEPNEYSSKECVIYRAMPNGCVIEEGDWVSKSSVYASYHERNSANSITVSEVVYEDEVYNGGAPEEEIYIPRGTWGEAESIRDVWNEINIENKPEGERVKKRSYEEIVAEKNNDTESSLNY